MRNVRGGRAARIGVLAGLIVLGLSSGCGGAAGRTTPETVAAESLEKFMSSRGYTRVPLSRLPTGHFSITGTAGDISLDMILDTGASHTVLDVERAARFGVETEDRGNRATGVGLSSQSVESGRLDDVEIGPVRFDTLRVSVLDLSQVNRVLRGLGNSPVDGIIGADVLMAREAVIDYGMLNVYLKR